MKKMLVFDMDGTIADLYGVKNWLEMLRSESDRPYREARPLYDMDSLNWILSLLKEEGWRIAVTSWLSKDSSDDYDEKVRIAKLEWLKAVQFPYDEIHIVKYGTLKSNCTRNFGGFQVLVDDNKEVRESWDLGDTIDASQNIFMNLMDLF